MVNFNAMNCTAIHIHYTSRITLHCSELYCNTLRCNELYIHLLSQTHNINSNKKFEDFQFMHMCIKIKRD